MFLVSIVYTLSSAAEQNMLVTLWVVVEIGDRVVDNLNMQCWKSCIVTEVSIDYI